MGTRLAAPEIAWPSLSDLSAALNVGRKALDTLGRRIRALGLRTAKIGRERRVAPEDAIRLLRERGLPGEEARAWVSETIARRTRDVPLLRRRARPTEPRKSRNGSQGTSRRRYPRTVANAARAFDEVNRVIMAPLPSGPTNIRSAEELVAAAEGGRSE